VVDDRAAVRRGFEDRTDASRIWNQMGMLMRDVNWECQSIRLLAALIRRELVDAVRIKIPPRLVTGKMR